MLERALGYPYPLTHQSFVYRAAMPDAVQLITAADVFPDVSARTPVLAVGSNQSPQQLARKFRGAEWGDIPTSRVHLRDFDTVYSAHVTGYGSIAATLHASPGTRVALYVNWLTDDQLAAMHETELPNENYSFGRLENVDLEVEAGPALSAVNLYMGRRGAYAPEGAIIPLAEVPASGRRFAARTQAQMLSAVQQRIAPEMDVEPFILSAIHGPETRQRYIEALSRTALAFASERFFAPPR
ncbi:MAG: hypothetical protein HQ483_14905 [Rhodospirillales bacterium]|nr:hypothetical protein [Rhodospirillales bacterium]